MFLRISGLFAAGILLTIIQVHSVFAAVGPTISTTSPLTAGTVGTFYSVTLTATSGITPYIWSLKPGPSILPDGLSLSITGELTGTPTTAGVYSFDIRVTDDDSKKDDKTFSLTIGAASSSSISSSSATSSASSAASSDISSSSSVALSSAASSDSSSSDSSVAISSSSAPSEEGESSSAVASTAPSEAVSSAGDAAGTNGTRRGNSTTMLAGLTDFITSYFANGESGVPRGSFGGIAPSAFGGPGEVFSENDLNVVCSIRRVLFNSPYTMNGAVVEWVADMLGGLLGRSIQEMLDALRSESLCAVPDAKVEASVKPIAFHIDAAGFPVSRNPTWNACIRNTATLADIRNNPDKSEDGIGRSCASYHTAKVWRHPDLGVYFTFDRKYRVVSLPTGYVVVRDQAVSQK